MNSYLFKGPSIGFRDIYLNDFIESRPFSWTEILLDNFLTLDPQSLDTLDLIAQNYALAFHCVNTSIAQELDLSSDYFTNTKYLIERYQPKVVSDHLCWNKSQEAIYRDLLPIPFAPKTLNLVADNISRLQDFYQCEFAVENISSYLEINNSTMYEYEFIEELIHRTNCQQIFDINNIYVNSVNRNQSPEKWISNYCLENIAYFHVAGFETNQNYLIDTHGESLDVNMLKLVESLKLPSSAPLLIERDSNLPQFNTLIDDLKRIDAVLVGDKNE